MSDEPRKETTTDDDPAATPDAGPIIPDGGLTDAMPDWLRRPPAWRGIPVPDLPMPPDATGESAPDAVADDALANAPTPDAPDATPVPDAEGEMRTPKTLPPPDTSPIDPTSLVELDDLPAWLIGIGKRHLPDTPAEAADAVPVPEAETPGLSNDDVPLPPFLRDEAATAEASGKPAVAGESGLFTGMSQRVLVMAGVAVVVIVVAIMLAYFG
ncbi:MAG: hypothetical protein QM753_03670 [Thermomicrobiales bacterium]